MPRRTCARTGTEVEIPCCAFAKLSGYVGGPLVNSSIIQIVGGLPAIRVIRRRPTSTPWPMMPYRIMDSISIDKTNLVCP